MCLDASHNMAMYEDSLKCIVPSISQFFRSQLNQDNKSGDLDRNHTFLNCHFLFLKLLLSGLKNLTSFGIEGKAKISRIISMDGFLLPLLVHIAISEALSFPVLAREQALIVLEMIQQSCGPSLLAETTTWQLGNMDRLLVPNSKQLRPIGAIDGLVRKVKSLRTNDSFRGTSILLSSLRVLHCYVHSMSPLLPETPEISGTGEEDDVGRRYSEKWGWVRVFLYDRRAAVKWLAANIVLDILEDMRRKGHVLVPKSEADEFIWPPIEQLGNLASDAYECVSIRMTAASSLALCIHHSDVTKDRPRDQKLDYDGPIAVGPLINCLKDVLQAASMGIRTNASFSGITSALRCINLLLTTPSGSTFENNISLMRSLKIFPFVAELLHKELNDRLLEAAFHRVQLQRSTFTNWIDTKQLHEYARTQEQIVHMFAAKIILNLRRVDFSLLLQQSTKFLPNLCDSLEVAMGKSEIYRAKEGNDIDIFKLQVQLQSVAYLITLFSRTLSGTTFHGIAQELDRRPSWPRSILLTISVFNEGLVILFNKIEKRDDIVPQLVNPVLLVMSQILSNKEWKSLIGMVNCTTGSPFVSE